MGTGERELHLGQIYGVNPQQLPSSVQYIGLGHLHRPQEILAPAKTLYSGSLIELDFGEREQDKRVVVFEAKAGRAVARRVGAAHAPAGGCATSRARSRSCGRWRASAATPSCACTCRAEAPVPGLAERVRELLPNALDVARAYHPAGTTRRPRPTARRVGTDPATLFAEYYRRRNKADAARRSCGRSSTQLHEEASR